MGKAGLNGELRDIVVRANKVIKKIIELSEDDALSFQDKANRLEAEVNACSSEDILNHLHSAGVIPEAFGHDSTEEKVFAKYCDALLARALTELGLNAWVILERSGAADVQARAGSYELVGDAKAFRLSRTAKNQKDFKVEALNQWRGNADYACLVAPSYQYPSRSSQIYAQAIRYNVTLLSYTHLAFMVQSQGGKGGKLSELWEIGVKLRGSRGISEDADRYWSTVLNSILKITGKDDSDWSKAVEVTEAHLREQGREQLRYWKAEKKRIQILDQKSAVNQLVKALKIDAKIEVVRATAGL